MADNQCSYVQQNIFQSMKYLETLHLAKNKLGCLFTGKNADRTFKGLKHLREIYVTSNNLDKISEAAFKDQTELQILKADDNKLSEFSPDLFRFTESLKSLDLSQNKISVLSEGNIKYLQNLDTLNLANNSFSCDCALRWFRDWMDSTKVVLLNASSYKCNGPKGWQRKSLLDFNRSKINCSFFSKYDIIVAVLAGVACTLLLVVFVYKNRWRLRLRLYLISKRGKLFVRNIRGEHSNRNYGTINNGQERFDAFVSCSEYDKPWALQWLLPGVDNGQLNDDTPSGGNFKLYYDDRDADAGVSIVANIFEHMRKSRKVIVVLTRHYFNGMNEFELDQAIALLHEHELVDIIVLKVGDVPTRRIPPHLYAKMGDGSFIEWEDNENAIITFREKLKDRLRSTRELDLL